MDGDGVCKKRESERKTGGLSFRMATGGKSSVDRKVKGAGPETDCVRNPARRKGLRGNVVSLTSKPVFPRYGEIRREGFRRNRRQTLYLHFLLLSQRVVCNTFYARRCQSYGIGLVPADFVYRKCGSEAVR